VSVCEGWLFFFSSRRRHTRSKRDWSSDVCSSDLLRRRSSRAPRRSPRRTGRRPCPGIRARPRPTPGWCAGSRPAWCGAGRPAARPGSRSRTPERLGAAQRLELVRQHLPLVVPRPLLLALLGDHLGGRPRDELLVSELGGEPRQLLLQPGQLARQAPTLLLQVDRSFQRDVHFAAVAEDGVRSDTFRAAVERKLLELREAPDRFALRLEHLPIIPPAGRDAGTETCLRWHFVLRTDAADLLHDLLDAQELQIEFGVYELRL